MRPISRYAHFMSSTVQIAPRISRDGDGVPSYGQDVAFLAHISKGVRLMPSMAGSDVVDAMQIYLNSVAAIQPTSRVTLSTSDVGSTESYDRQPRLLAIERRFDSRGPHHSVLYVGWAPRSV